MYLTTLDAQVELKSRQAGRFKGRFEDGRTVKSLLYSYLTRSTKSLKVRTYYKTNVTYLL